MNQPVKIENVGFVFISTGPYAHTYRAETCIESLVKSSGFKGPIFLITDKPTCFDLDRLKRVSGSQNIFLCITNSISKRIDLPFALTLENRVVKIDVVEAWKKSYSKKLKSKIFEFVPLSHKVDVLIYSDVDLIFQKSSKWSDLMDEAIKWTVPGIKMRVNRWSKKVGDFDSQCNIHTGFFIAHRYLSEEALKAWEKQMSIRRNWIRNGSDKEKYLRAVKKYEKNGQAELLKVQPLGFYEGFYSQKKEVADLVAVHISMARFRFEGPRLIDNYIHKKSLKSFPAGHYTFPCLPLWLVKLFFSPYWPYLGSYKLEDISKMLSGLNLDFAKFSK